MIVLLASVFFSGFLLDLQLIWDPVKVLSWSLPTTYGIATIRDIFLLGQPPNIIMIMGLFGIGVALMLISWFLLRREIASE
jgi:ABC-type multidrug transport system permease subunit